MEEIRYYEKHQKQIEEQAKSNNQAFMLKKCYDLYKLNPGNSTAISLFKINFDLYTS